jgi:hypothetical protein
MMATVKNDPATKFARYHERMLDKDIPIPHHVLREYLDAMRLAQKCVTHPANVTITVSTEANIALLRTDAILKPNIVIRIARGYYE